jgi:hypothetical protein
VRAQPSILCGLAIACAIAIAACGGARAEPVRAAIALPQPTDAPSAREEDDAQHPPAEEHVVDASTAVWPHPRCSVAVNVAKFRGRAEAPLVSSILAADAPYRELGDAIDPVRDTDWLVYTGPTFMKNAESVFLLRYNVADAMIDARVSALGAELRAKGTTTDPPVPFPGTIDGYPRALMKPQPNIFAIVPPSLADRASHALVGVKLEPPTSGNEAVRAHMRRPGVLVPALATTVYEARGWIVLDDDGGADFFAEADCPTGSDAVVVANDLRHELSFVKSNAFMKVMMGGALDAVEIVTDGTTVRAHAALRADQVTALLTLAQNYLTKSSP